MTFEFATAGRIVYGIGTARQIPAIAHELGRHALVVVGGSGRGCEALTKGLEELGVASVVFRVSGEPTTHLVDDAARIARSARCDLVIALGGGSVIDAGKAVAALIANPGDALDYIEVVGKAFPLRAPSAPLVAVPTTAGTGAEATRNAVLGVPEHGVKASLRSAYLFPRVAVVDPKLTLSLPPAVTAYTGMDALTQLIEVFVSNAANPFTDGICREGLTRAARSLASAHRDGSDLAAREDMALAALLSGVALANARLGAVHGFASVLGGATGQAHGALCARLLPFVMDANLRAIGEQGDPSTLGRYTEIARILSGDPAAEARDGVTRVHTLCTDLNIPPLRDAGLSPADCRRLIPLAQRASSTKGNPVVLSDQELLGILEAAR
jgi:alcohol dehydrogenase class IV